MQRASKLPDGSYYIKPTVEFLDLLFINQEIEEKKRRARERHGVVQARIKADR